MKSLAYIYIRSLYSLDTVKLLKEIKLQTQTLLEVGPACIDVWDAQDEPGTFPRPGGEVRNDL